MFRRTVSTANKEIVGQRSDQEDVRRSFWDFSSVLGSRLASIPLALCVVAVSTRILGKEGYGILSLFLLVSQLFFLFGINWTCAAVVKYAKEEFVEQGKINGTFWARNALLIPSLLLSLTVVWLYRDQILSYIGLGPAAIWLLVLYLIGLTMADYGQSVLQATGNLQFYSVAKLLQMLLLLAAFGLLFVFFNGAGRTYQMIWAYVLSVLLVSLVPLYKISYRLFSPPVFEKHRIKKIFIFSYPVIFGSVSAYVVNWIDLIVIKRYSTVSEIGVYSLSYQGMTAVQQICMAIGVVITPMMVSFLVRGRKDLILRYLDRIVPQGMILWIFFICTVTFGSFYLIPLVFGIDFRESCTPFALLMIGMGWNALNTLYSPVMTSYELIKQSMGIGIVIAVVNFAGDMLLVPLFGISGASMATAFSFFLGGVLSHFVVYRHMGLRGYKELLLPVSSLLAIILLVASSHLLLRLLCFFVISFGLWMIARMLRLFNKEDLALLKKIEMPRSVWYLIEKAYTCLG